MVLMLGRRLRRRRLPSFVLEVLPLSFSLFNQILSYLTVFGNCNMFASTVYASRVVGSVAITEMMVMSTNTTECIFPCTFIGSVRVFETFITLRFC